MARSVSLGLVAALGAALLVPATATLASADVHATVTGPVCPATSTPDEVNAFLKTMDAATAAKAKSGYYLKANLTNVTHGTMSFTVRKDAAHHRWNQSHKVNGEPVRYVRTLENGYDYLLVTRSTSAEDRAALKVLKRSSGWTYSGKSTDQDVILLSETDPSTTAAKCIASASGLTLTFSQDTADVTVRTDATKALANVRATTKDRSVTMTISVAYGAQSVPSLTPQQRISANTWGHALAAGSMRTAMRTWANKVSEKAKAKAAAAHRAVRASDVKSVAKKYPLSRTLRSYTKTGVLVVMKDRDPYTHKQLRLRVTVASKKVKITDNW